MGYATRFAPGQIAKLEIEEQTAGWGEIIAAWTNTIECTNPTFGPPLEIHRPESIAAGHWARPKVLGSRKGDTLGFTVRMHGESSSILNNDPTEFVDSILAKLGVGASLIEGYYDPCDLTGSTTQTIKVDDAAPPTFAEWKAGQGIILQPASGSDHLLGVIKERTDASPDELDLLYTLAGNPSTSATGTIFGTNTIYPTTGNLTPCTLRLTGQVAGQQWIFRDCIFEKLTIKVAPGGQLEMDCQLKVGTWSHDSGAAALTSYSHNEDYLPVAIGRYGGLLGVFDTPDSYDYPCGDLTLEITNALAEVPQFSGVDGLARYIKTGQEIKLSATLPFQDYPDDSTDMQDALAQEDVQLYYHLGTTPGMMFGFVLPNMSVEALPTADAGGIRGLQLEAVCEEHTDDEAGEAAPANTHFRMFFG